MCCYEYDETTGVIQSDLLCQLHSIHVAVQSVDYEDILFFETSSNIHKVILHAKDRQIEFPSTLKELTGVLDSNFVRCHRAFLVNKNNIKEVDTKNRIIHFANGETCLMSTRMMKGL